MDCIPASGLKAQVPNAGRNRTHVVLLPTFPILRAGESHYREKTKFPKLAETLSFLPIWACPAGVCLRGHRRGEHQRDLGLLTLI